MPEDLDANVVKIIIHEEGYIPLMSVKAMAEVATGLGVETFPTTSSRLLMAFASPAMKWSKGESNDASVRSLCCKGDDPYPPRHVPPESLHKLKSRYSCRYGDPGHSIADAGRAHLERIRDRQCRLLLQRIDPAVPKLRLVIKRIQQGGRVALADAAVDAD